MLQELALPPHREERQGGHVKLQHALDLIGGPEVDDEPLIAGVEAEPFCALIALGHGESTIDQALPVVPQELGVLQEIAHGIYVESEEIKAAEKRVTEMLSGQINLGPADFKEALPVTRKRLIPLLNYLDGKGTTVRHENGRDVPERG